MKTHEASRDEDVLISVITVTLNAGDRLASTTASLDAQRFTGFEHIIKDGGSTDGSLGSLPSHGNRRIVVQPDCGIYDGMNQGASLARGRYLMFLNAGDRLRDVDALARLAEEARLEDFGVIYADVYDDYRRAEVVFPGTLGGSYLFRNTVCHQAVLVRKSSFDQLGGFDKGLEVAGDHDLLVRLVKKAGVRTKHVASVCVVYEGGGYSERNRRQLLRDHHTIRARHFPLVERLVYAFLLMASLPGSRRAILIKYPRIASWYRRLLHSFRARQERRLR